ncbi:MAG: tetratricopeptide repeat protein [Gemmataceae bacterium]|nr:tetratricopeptide repeat protein [Gemmataceae bacterium]
MPNAPTCPEPQQLEDYATGRLALPELEQLARHLEQCASCTARLETLRGGASTTGKPGRLLTDTHLPGSGPARPDGVTATSPGAGLAGHAGPAPVIPGYALRGKLGHGGMGVVYEAEQIALKRTVALKVVLAGGHADSEQLARFRGEAEAVARLQHPNIVQIHEVGECAGLPYFVMEFVPGGGLDRQLGGKPQPPQVAAALVEALAQAIQAAHDKGVVHRDLKPANVLLTADGTPKIADFGLAKRLDDTGFKTASDAVMGTPSYMAPEQAAGQVRSIGPLSDVYALGAILYELLTGRPPFKGATAADTLLQVLNQEPVPPRRLNPQATRDLETICLKCLQKQPGRRYASAQDLADDLGRFQRGEPIRARPVGAAERAWRWCRRNPAVAALSAAALLLLVGGLVGMTALYLNAEHQRTQAEAQHAQAVLARAHAEDERRRADEERDRARKAALVAERQKKEADEQRLLAREQADRARQVTDSLKGMFEVSDPMGLNGFFYGSSDQLAGTELTALALIDYCKERVHKSKHASPRVRADILDTIGNVYRSLGRYRDAEELLQTALDLRRQGRAPPAEIAASLHSLGWVNHELGKYHKALELYREGLKLRLEDPEPDDLAIANSQFNLGWALAEVEQLDEAEQLFKSALARREKRFGPYHRDTALARVGLVAVYLETQRYLAAGPMIDQIVGTFRQLGADPLLPDALSSFQKGVFQSMVLGDHKAGEKELRHSVELARKKLGPKHLYVSMPLVQLAMIIEKLGPSRYAEVQALHEEALAIARERVGLGHPKLLVAVRHLTEIQRRRGQVAQAEKLYEEVLAAHKERFGAADPFVADVLADYADFLGLSRQAARGEKLRQEAAAIYRAAAGPPRRRFAPCLNLLGVARFRASQYDEAEKLFREGREVARRRQPLPAENLCLIVGNLAQALLSQGKYTDEVGGLLTEAEALLRKLAPAERRHLAHDLVLRRCQYVRMTKGDHAEVAKRLAEYRKSMLPHGWRYEEVAFELAQCLPLVERQADEEERARLREAYGAEVVALLRLAWQGGAPQASSWGNHPLLRPLREREDFQQLLAQVRKK